MRILLVMPRQPRETGNRATAERYAAGLRSYGHVVEIVEVDPDAGGSLGRHLAAFRPDLGHLLHAWRSGKPWLEAQGDPPVPYLVTLTGTDINHDIDTAERGAVCRRVLGGARAIVTQNPLTAGTLQRRFPEWRARIRYLPQGVALGGEPYPLRARHAIPADAPLFLHPAGIRPVKGNLELLEIFAAVAARRPRAVLAFCGPELDAAYAARFRAALVAAPWARYLGTIPPSAMPAALRACDVVLNHSVSEGLSHALLEVTVVGVPILARDIEGNRAAVAPGGNGLLYRSAAEFCAAALRLIDSPELRQRLGRPRPQSFRPEVEAETLHRLVVAALDGQVPAQ